MTRNTLEWVKCGFCGSHRWPVAECGGLSLCLSCLYLVGDRLGCFRRSRGFFEGPDERLIEKIGYRRRLRR